MLFLLRIAFARNSFISTCRGIDSCLSPFLYMSCFLPCLEKVHPSLSSILTNSNRFMVQVYAHQCALSIPFLPTIYDPPAFFCSASCSLIKAANFSTNSLFSSLPSIFSTSALRISCWVLLHAQRLPRSNAMTGGKP